MKADPAPAISPFEIRVRDAIGPRAYISPMPEPVIVVRNLGKRYGRTVAVDDVSLEVREGEIFGLIGPNGAGKTTTMECVEGLRRPTRGTITVLGLDPHRDADALRQRIGVQHQEAQLQKRIKVWEAVDLWASLYDSARRRRRHAARAARTRRASATRGS